MESLYFELSIKEAELLHKKNKVDLVYALTFLRMIKKMISKDFCFCVKAEGGRSINVTLHSTKNTASLVMSFLEGGGIIYHGRNCATGEEIKSLEGVTFDRIISIANFISKEFSGP